MAGTLSPSEEAQLQQTIEMFEVITQSQPQDYQSLEILKEAYLKLGREPETISTSKRIAEAYVQLGQLSSAILEYETILQRSPDDQDVARALAEIESTANTISTAPAEPEPEPQPAVKPAPGKTPAAAKAAGGETAALDDGGGMMRKLFVDGKHIAPAEFDLCWPSADSAKGSNVAVPFIQQLHEKNVMNIEKSLKLLVDKSRLGYLPLELYDVHIDTARAYPATVCRRWCVLPFDRVGKVVLVATTNPFNARAMRELQDAHPGRIQWYLAAPAELTREIKKIFRS